MSHPLGTVRRHGLPPPAHTRPPDGSLLDVDHKVDAQMSPVPRGARSAFASAPKPPAPDRVADVLEVRGGKGSVFYRAHSYHTKVPVEGLTRLIEHYTDPGDVIADPFCGSGMTGVAALLTGRRAVISDLSPAAVHIARGYTAKADPALVSVAGQKVLGNLRDLEAHLYGDPAGRIEYTVWSDVYACPQCDADILFWDAGFDRPNAQIISAIHCPSGHGPFTKAGLVWRSAIPVQQNLLQAGERRRLVRDVEDPAELALSVSRSDVLDWFPDAPWEPWREMWRGQHKALSIATSADFFTNRNLLGLSALWREIHELDDAGARDALRFVFTSIVNRASRRYQWHPSRPTNVLSSTMYVAALNYEFNVFSLFRRKLSTIVEMYERTSVTVGECEVRQGSATDLEWLADASIDYVFTDPPFGSNIFYADSSFLWESWLQDHTDMEREAVVNKRVGQEHGGKGLEGYEGLMSDSMTEIQRILRPNAWASLQFHNSDDAVWSSVQRSLETAGFRIASAVVMDKGQASFKGLRHAARGEKVANFDLVMHLQTASRSASNGAPVETRATVEAELIRILSAAPPSRRTTPWLHSSVLRFLLSTGSDLNGWSFAAVEQLCNEVFDRKGTTWALRTDHV